MYKVMIVDDEKYVRKSIVNSLDWEKLDLEIVAEAENGEKAFSLYKQVNPHIILTDIKMPVMNGIDLIKEVRSLHADVEFIILSGYDDFEYTKEAIKLGVSNYIKKPINEGELENTLQLIVNKFKERQDSQKYISVLRDQAEKGKSILYEKYLSKYIDENIQDTDININFCSEIFTILMIYLESTSGVLYNLDILKEYLDSNIKSVMEKLDLGDYNSFIFGIQQHNQVLCILLSCNHLKNDAVKRISSWIKDAAMNDMAPGFSLNPVSMVFTPVFNSIKLIPNNFTRSLKLLKCKIFSNEWLISDEAKIFLHDKAFSNIVYNSIDLIKQAIENRKLNDVSAILNRILCKDNSKKFSLELLESLVLELGNLLRIFALKYGEDNFDRDYEVILQPNYILRFSNLESLKNHLLLQLNNIFSNIFTYDNSSIVERVRQFISVNYPSNLSLTSIAREFFINPSYLSQLFKAKIGINLSAYIEDTRIEQAKQLLNHLDLNISTVASMVGYNDPNYFTKIFKSKTGVLPSSMLHNK